MERSGTPLLTFDMDINFIEGPVTIKILGAYKYHDGFCFNFAMAMWGYVEGNMDRFNGIIDSIRFENITSKEDIKDAYTIFQ